MAGLNILINHLQAILATIEVFEILLTKIPQHHFVWALCNRQHNPTLSNLQKKITGSSAKNTSATHPPHRITNETCSSDNNVVTSKIVVYNT